MGLRDGQERVEVRPGVWLWQDKVDKKAVVPESAPVERATEAPHETAVMPASKPRKR